MKKALIALSFGAATLLPPVHAITLNYESGVVHETSGFASFSTTGAEMAGMGVHVEYADGGTYDTVWQQFGVGSGGVNNSNFFIQAGQTGTSGYPWALFNPTARSIRSISLDGQPGNTVFDVSFPFGEFAGFGFIGTAGTSSGREFDLRSLYAIYDGLTVTYSDAVALTGADPVGDIFRRMTIEFASDRLLGSQGYLEFAQDTDSLAFGSVLVPVAPSSVPDGGLTLAMLSAGLVGLAAIARRRGLTTN